MKKMSLVVVVCLLASLPALAQVDTAWVRVLGNPGVGQNIAVDTLGNVYVNGYGDNPLGGMTVAYDSAGQTLWSRFSGDIYTYSFTGIDMAINQLGDIYIVGPRQVDNLSSYNLVRYSTLGDSFWTRIYRGPVYNSAFPSALTSDSLGNVYVTGNSDGPSWATLKYDREGNLIWTALYTGYPNLSPGSVDEIALDSEGNVVVLGTTRGRFNQYLFGATTVKYNNNGNQIWATSYDSISVLESNHLAIDPAGNILVSAIAERQSAQYRCPAIIKYLPNGDTAWVRIYEPANDAEGRSYVIAVDSAGYTYVAGPTYVSSDSNYYDFLVIKYAPDGETSWVRTYDSGYEDVPVDIAIGQSGAVYIAGHSRNESAGFDFLVAKYAPDGSLGWIARYNSAGSNSDIPNALAVDKWENIYVTGSSGEHFTTVKFVQTETGLETGPLPMESLLLFAYPNPFNAQTTIQYELPAPANVDISVFEILGHKIETLVNGHQIAGRHQAIWNAAGVSSGIYFFRLRAGNDSVTRKLLLVK